MKKGYARVSTIDQNLNRQLDALSECDMIYHEKITGTTKERPELKRLLAELREGDIVIIPDLTRLSRSTMDLLAIVEQIKEKGASIKSLKDTWLDTTSENPYNSFLLTIMSGLAQLERDLISVRTKEGLESARKRGNVGGRPIKNKGKVELAIKLKAEGRTVREIEELTGVSKATLYRKLKAD